MTSALTFCVCRGHWISRNTLTGHRWLRGCCLVWVCFWVQKSRIFLILCPGWGCFHTLRLRVVCSLAIWRGLSLWLSCWLACVWIRRFGWWFRSHSILTAFLLLYSRIFEFFWPFRGNFVQFCLKGVNIQGFICSRIHVTKSLFHI